MTPNLLISPANNPIERWWHRMLPSHGIAPIVLVAPEAGLHSRTLSQTAGHARPTRTDARLPLRVAVPIVASLAALCWAGLIGLWFAIV